MPFAKAPGLEEAMASQADFDRLDILIRQRKGRFLASLPQINLFAAADSVAAAIEGVDRKKQALLADLAAANALDDFRFLPFNADVSTYHKPTPAAIYRGALSFIAKVAVITAAMVIAGFLLSRQVTQTVDRMLSHQSAELRDRFSSVGGAKFWVNLENQLARAADPNSDLPPAKKQEILSQIRAITERWRPFIREASLLFSDSTEPRPTEPAAR
jgi:hypothetical protein